MQKNKHDHDPINPFASKFAVGIDLRKTHQHQKNAMVIVRDRKARNREVRDRKHDTVSWTF